MEGGCCRTRRIPKPCRTVTRPVAAAYGTARGLGVADLLDEMDCREDPQLADQEYDGLDSPLVPRDRHRIPLGRRHIHPLGQLAPQNAILGLQVVDHLGQFGLGRPGQNHEQRVENPGHAAITQVLGSVEHDNVFEHRRGGPEFLATSNRPKCPGGTRPDHGQNRDGRRRGVPTAVTGRALTPPPRHVAAPSRGARALTGC